MWNVDKTVEKIRFSCLLILYIFDRIGNRRF